MTEESSSPKPTDPSPSQLISNLAEADAYITGYVDGVIIALALRPLDTAAIQARMARVRELDE